jgi:hypothetical protein
MPLLHNTELNTLADMRGNNIIGLEEMSKKTITTEEAIDLIMRLSINEQIPGTCSHLDCVDETISE